MGIAIARFGLQVQTTAIYAYTAEVSACLLILLAELTIRQCYRQQAAEIGLLLSLCRAIFSFCMGFHALPLGERIGYQNAWLIFAFIVAGLSVPVMALLFIDERWRQALGVPMFDPDL